MRNLSAVTLTDDVATKEYVDPDHSTQSATTYTLAAGDQNSVVSLTNAAAVTVTIPLNASVALDVGFCVVLFSEGAGGVTLSTSGITLLGTSPNTTVAVDEGLFLQKTATDTWVIMGGTSA